MPGQDPIDRVPSRTQLASWAPNTRQRVALDWTPLSLQPIREGPRGSSGSLPLTRARRQLAACIGAQRQHLS